MVSLGKVDVCGPFLPLLLEDRKQIPYHEGASLSTQVKHILCYLAVVSLRSREDREEMTNLSLKPNAKLREQKARRQSLARGKCSQQSCPSRGSDFSRSVSPLYYQMEQRGFPVIVTILSLLQAATGRRDDVDPRKGLGLIHQSTARQLSR